MRFLRTVVLAAIVAVVLSAGLAAQGRKVALVVGNSAYATGPLRNPANDARDVAAALRQLGFSVTLQTDADKKTMYRLADQFGSDIRGADIALFYYSGHGVQANGENYLIPVGAEIGLASDVEIEGAQLQRIMGRLNAGGAGTNVVILDACRNNPFPQASRGMEKGLAVVGQKPPESVIVYATEAGEAADDGNGRNGVFAAALLRNIKRNEEFTALLRDVNAEVRRQTGQKQKPATYDNLTHGVYPAGEAGRGNDEVQHEVALSAFLIGKEEVTQAEWTAVMGSNPSAFKGDSLPVEQVSWYDCVAYCNKRSEREGLAPCYAISGTEVSCDFGAKGYRLPTEAEWEYAAKGGPRASSAWIEAEAMAMMA
jgi:hypothetical protein